MSCAHGIAGPAGIICRINRRVVKSDACPACGSFREATVERVASPAASVYPMPDLRQVAAWEALEDQIRASGDAVLYGRLLGHLQHVETSPSLSKCQLRHAREQLWHDLQTFNARHAQEAVPGKPAA